MFLPPRCRNRWISNEVCVLLKGESFGSWRLEVAPGVLFVALAWLETFLLAVRLLFHAEITAPRYYHEGNSLVLRWYLQVIPFCCSKNFAYRNGITVSILPTLTQANQKSGWSVRVGGLPKKNHSPEFFVIIVLAMTMTSHRAISAQCIGSSMKLQLKHS